MFWKSVILTIVLAGLVGCGGGGQEEGHHSLSTKSVDVEIIDKNLQLQDAIAKDFYATDNKQELRAMAQKIEQLKSVRKVHFDAETGNIDIFYTNGMVGGLRKLPDSKHIKGGSITDSQRITGKKKNLRALNNIPLQNKKVLALALQYWEWGNQDDVPEIVDLLEADGSFDIKKVYQRQDSGDLDLFKHLDEYGIVLISSHGNTLKSGQNTQTVILNTNVAPTRLLIRQYATDMTDGLLMAFQIDKNRSVFYISPKFIQKYNKHFNKSLIYMSICKGAYNNTMARAFLSTGATVYLGYSDNVAVNFTRTQGKRLFRNLLTKDKDNTFNNISESFTPGVTEIDDDPAEFRKYASLDLIAIKGNNSSLVDGSNYQGGTGLEYYSSTSSTTPISTENTYSDLDSTDYNYDDDFNITSYLDSILNADSNYVEGGPSADLSGLYDDSDSSNDFDNNGLANGDYYQGGTGYNDYTSTASSENTYSDYEYDTSSYPDGTSYVDGISSIDITGMYAENGNNDNINNTYDSYNDEVQGFLDTEQHNIESASPSYGQYFSAEELYSAKCVGCHGPRAEKHALGKSEVIAGWSVERTEEALKNYQAGLRNVHGFGMLMKGQLNDLSESDLNALAVYIYQL